MDAEPGQRRKRLRLWLALCLGGAALVAACAYLWAKLGTLNTSEEALSLASLRQVDDYPLYVMDHYGDYGFAESIGGRPRLSAVAAEPAWACTTFAAHSPDGDAIVGRNFDWHGRASLLLFTHPTDAYASASMVDLSYLGDWEEDKERLLDAPHWPFDGMNERGLAIGMMALDRSRGPMEPGRPTLGSLAVIRLLLDYAADVEEAVALLGRYNVSFQSGPPVHYLIADRGGRSAIVEYIDGEMRVLPNGEDWQVSTNFIISEVQPQGADSPCWRYNTAWAALGKAAGLIAEEQAMSILADTAQGNTMWSVVYNLANGGIQVAVGQEYGTIHAFTLDD